MAYSNLRRAQSNLSLGTTVSESSSMQGERRQFRPQQPHRAVRPLTAFDSVAAVSHSTDPSIHGSANSQTLSPNYGGGGGYSVVRPYSTAMSDDVHQLSGDGYFTALDPMRPPDHWTFSPAPSSSGGIGSGHAFKSNYGGGTALMSDSLTVNTHLTATTSATASPSVVDGSGPLLTTPQRIETFVARRSMALERDGVDDALSPPSQYNTDYASISTTPPTASTTAASMQLERGGRSMAGGDTLTVRTERTEGGGGHLATGSITTSLSSQPSPLPSATLNAPRLSYHQSRHQPSSNGDIELDSVPLPMSNAGITMRSVRIERMYRQDGRCRFQADPMPSALERYLGPGELRETIDALNRLLAEGEDSPSRSLFCNMFSCITLYLGFCCTRSNYQKTLDRASAFLVEENKRLYHSRGLEWRDPRATAFLHLELLIP
ncbi:Golgin subfamily A member 7/ERF4 family-domain-containing protein [Thamnocephalis sphaerospora]|uniref:Ras modification protein ERF4 n=1 Tax=Thamnocephalis sphaerospora TaxID=78915 RepID=A0A4P9XN56_9FUNG|nr:Golgin subfamily A member 7/ERF4 family-domain-containing protein [Thamnocephalis sphaerospora]|eukprot:RKP07363.1 Golgin subfamily A member 7/ERF4 family-domain-containing protein [Thamnocephalis sphaerospora]